MNVNLRMGSFRQSSSSSTKIVRMKLVNLFSNLGQHSVVISMSSSPVSSFIPDGSERVEFKAGQSSLGMHSERIVIYILITNVLLYILYCKLV